MKKLYSYVLASLFVLVGISAGNSLSAMKKQVELYPNQNTFQEESTKMLELRALYLKEIRELQEQVLEFKKIIAKAVPAQNNCDVRDGHEVNGNQSLIQDVKQSIKSSIKRIVWFLVKWPVFITILSGMGLGLLFGVSYLVGGMPLVLPLWAFIKTVFRLVFSGLKTGAGSIATGIGSRLCSLVPTTSWLGGKLFGRFCPARV
ncbi:MAG: hypothetical protein ABH827_02085 [bacterium]